MAGNIAGFITAADAIVTLACTPIFTAPQTIEGFGEDQVFGVPMVEIAITRMGVDGQMAAGYIFVKQPWNFTLLPSSPSCDVFDDVKAAQDAARTTFYWQGFVTAPSLGKSWELLNGTLTRYSPASDARQVFADRTFELTWQRVIPIPFIAPTV